MAPIAPIGPSGPGPIGNWQKDAEEAFYMTETLFFMFDLFDTTVKNVATVVWLIESQMSPQCILGQSWVIRTLRMHVDTRSVVLSTQGEAADII